MKKKLFQYSLEEYTEKKQRNLPRGWSNTLGYILENGPVNPKIFSNQVALEALVEEGLVSEAVVNDETEETVVATPEGKEVYNEVLFQDNEERPLSEILDKAETTEIEETPVESGEVSQEGFIDWVKDLFTSKLTEKDVIKARASRENIKTFVNRDIDLKLYISGWNGGEDLIDFFFKSGKIVDNIATGIKEDIPVIEKFTKVLANLNETFSKLRLETPEGEARSIIDEEYDTSLTYDLHGQAIQNGVVFNIRKKMKIGREDTVPDDYFDKSTVIYSPVYGPDGKPIGQARTTVPTSRGQLDNYINQANGSLKDNKELQKAFGQINNTFESVITELDKLVKNNARLKGAQASAIRGLIRNGHNVGLTVYYVIRAYGGAADIFLDIVRDK